MTEPQPADRRTISQDHSLGFGCASLYGIPEKRDRRAVLESAYELGIRHFDVAPMYGLGLAEAELADFVGTRTDVCVATKFGIRPTAIGRLAGLVQPPIRRILQNSATVKSKVKQSGSGPGAGAVGRLLYSRPDFSVASARGALAASLRALRSERIDYFLLHEPVGAPGEDHGDLIGYLETERRRGVIGNWGPAGDLSHMDAGLTSLSGRSSALQFPYDLIAGHSGPPPKRDQSRIAFGFLSGTLPRVQAVLGREPQFRQQCSELLDLDLADERSVVKLLVRDAVTQNRGGTVLLSSTNTAKLEMACAAANVALRNEEEVAIMIRNRLQDAEAQR